MAQLGVKMAVITMIVLIVLVFVAQLVVGVLGTANQTVNKTLVAAATGFSVSPSVTASSNAINITNSISSNIILTLSGSYSWINTQYPIKITLTGNSITTLASNTAYAVAGAAISQTFTVNSNATTQTLTTTTANFYNITGITITGTTGFGTPSYTASIAESFNAVAHGSAPASFTENTITASDAVTVGKAQAVAQFDSAGSGNTTVINFIPIVILVAVIVVILALFGLRDLLNIGEATEV